MHMWISAGQAYSYSNPSKLSPCAFLSRVCFGQIGLKDDITDELLENCEYSEYKMIQFEAFLGLLC